MKVDGNIVGGGANIKHHFSYTKWVAFIEFYGIQQKQKFPNIWKYI